MKYQYVLFPALLLTLVGCGKEHSEVTGKVTLAGKPVPKVRLSFMAEPWTETHAPFTTAVTDEEGRFFLRTHEGRDGAVVGSYTVLLKDMTTRGTGKLRIPRKYCYAAQTPLKGVRVDSGGNELNFELTASDEHPKDSGRRQ